MADSWLSMQSSGRMRVARTSNMREIGIELMKASLKVGLASCSTGGSNHQRLQEGPSHPWQGYSRR